jgi:hypothetical protein
MTIPRRILLLIFALQIALLTIGITRDYQLKHEDNNALHATFARSHLTVGFSVTRGQNYFFNPRSRFGYFYPNHPPGPGLVLAAVYGVTGHDGPAITRGVAIAFHVLGTWLFYGLITRVLRRRWELVAAMLLYVALPESAFFGRMLNHEVLVLPAAILLVRAYWESVYGTWPRGRAMAAMAGAAVFAAINGWGGFFAIGACAAHAGWEVLVRRNRRAMPSFVMLLLAPLALFAVVAGQLLWILGGNVAYLRTLLGSRMAGGDSNALQWAGRILELHWRYFGLTSAIAMAGFVYRAFKRKSGDAPDPAQEVGLIFLMFGAGYVGVFAHNATLHDYWQFFLLPASAIGVVLLLRPVVEATSFASRPWLRRGVLALVAFDILLVSSVTLVQRHVKREGYCLDVVESIRRNCL